MINLERKYIVSHYNGELILYSYVLEYLSTGRKALISHYLNPKLILVLHVIKSSDGPVLVIDENKYLVNTGLIEYVQDNALVSIDKGTRIPRNHRLVLIEPKKFPWRIFNKNILITLTPRNYRFKIPSFYGRIYLNRIGDHGYELFIKDTMEKYRFNLNGLEIVFEDKPHGVLGRAYEVLKKAFIEYGELYVRDAVSIISRELGVSRDNARELLSKLVINKYVRIEKKHVIVY